MRKSVATHWVKASTSAVLLATGLMSSAASATILPPNDLWKEDDINRKDANMTETEFNTIIDNIINYYTPIVAAHGATLTVAKNWNDPTVNAYAQQTGTTWNVAMFGGLARRPETTKDGFALVVCHELGHHLGGFAFYGATDWAASEGESDYFATQSCAHQIWGNQAAENALSRNMITGTAKNRCDQYWTTAAAQNLCYRTALASHSLATLLGALGNQTVNFDTPVTTQVTATNTAHPAAQCRLDTYFNGALCGTAFNPSVIPGRNHPMGQLSRDAEVAAMLSSCMGYANMGARPRCWFRPTVNSFVNVTDFQLTEVNGNHDNYLDPGEVYRVKTRVANLGPAAYPALHGVLSSSANWVSVESSQADYPNLPVQGSVWQMDDFRISIANNAVCGASFPLSVAVNDNTFTDSFSRSFQVGREVSSNLQNQTANLDIPDNMPAGIMSTAAVTATGGYQRVEVTVDITHTYIGDLTVTLVSPSGQETILHNRDGGATENIRKTFTANISGTESSGNWALKVIDAAAADTGRLNTWGIRFKSFQCNPN